MRIAALALVVAACTYGKSYSSVDATTQTPLVMFTPAIAQVTEGQNGSFSVALGSPPAHDVTVDVSSQDPAHVQLLNLQAPDYHFTPDDWNQPQVVDIIGMQDDDTVDDTVTFVGSGPEVAPGVINVLEHDDDTLHLVIDTTPIMVSEGSSTMLMMTLSAQPTNSLTIEATTSAPDTLSILQPLVFTADNWKYDQFIGIVSNHDTNTVSEDTTLQLSAPGIPTVMIAIHNVDTGP